MQVSLIIVNYNSGLLLERCVRSCLDQVRQIIIVDNASTDYSLNFTNFVEFQAPDLILIRNKSNLGFATACNQGLQQATFDTILFLNPDAAIPSKTIHRLYSALHSQTDIGMVGGCITNMDGSEQAGCRRLFPTPIKAAFNILGLSKVLGKKNQTIRDFNLNQEELPSDPIEAEAISGACMLVKKEAIEDVGLWDEGYFLHCEDLDWCMRFHQKNWKIMFVPDAKVTHVGGACSKSRPIFVELHKHKGMIRFYRKFYRQQYPVLLWPMVVATVWARFFLIASYYSVHHLLRRAGLTRG